MYHGRDMLRKAGQRIMDFDAAYAKKIEDGVKRNMEGGGPLAITEGIRGMTSGVALRDTFNRPGNNPENIKERVMLHAMEGGVAAANIASRYALPAGGVTLAGVGLYDLAAQFGGPADYQEHNQLSM